MTLTRTDTGMLRVLASLALGLTGACVSSGPGAPDYEAAFVEGRVVDWAIEVDDLDWLHIVVDPSSAPCADDSRGPYCDGAADCPDNCGCRAGVCALEYVPATITVDGVRYDQVGVRITGARDAVKKELRVDFAQYAPDRRFHGLKRIDLHANVDDPTLVREVLALGLLRAAGVPAPRATPVTVSVNGTALGVYAEVEHVDKAFLRDRFGEDGGVLYKLERGGTLVYEGDDPAGYDPAFETRYELKTDEAQGDVSTLIALMRTLALDPDARAAALPGVLDVDGTLTALAVNSWLANLDAYPGASGNLYLYRDAGGRFRYIPWHLARAFGNYHGVSCLFTTDDLLALDPDEATCGDPRPLFDALVATPAWRDGYHDRLLALVDDALAPAGVAAEAERLHTLVRDAAHADGSDGYSPDEFDAAFTHDVPEGQNPVRVPGLVPFVDARDARIRELGAGW